MLRAGQVEIPRPPIFHEDINEFKDFFVSLSNYIEKSTPSNETKIAVKDIIGEVFEKIDTPLDYTKYLFQSLTDVISDEFDGQVNPVKAPEREAKIVLSDQDSEFFNITVKDNHVINGGKSKYTLNPFSSVYYLDDCFPLYMSFIRPFVNTSYHAAVLQTKLFAERETKSTLESIYEDEYISKALEMLGEITPGELVFDQALGKFEYREKGTKLAFGNLADGVKFFSLLKSIISNKDFKPSSLLILDEPEAHLHPDWENVLAETLVFLVRTLKCHIVVSTESFQTVYALETILKRDGIFDKSAFYKTEKMADGFVTHKEQSLNMAKIYGELGLALEELSSLRDIEIEYD